MKKGFGLTGVCVGVAGVLITATKKYYKDNKTYDEDGYNSKGYDKNGYNRSGYNKKGYDKTGYDSEGYDKNGYNRSGYNRSGYNSSGYDRDGFKIDGYDRNGYNRDGYDTHGYDKYGFNKCEKNKSGQTRDEVAGDLLKIVQLAKKAEQQMKHSEFKYALTDCRSALETLIKILIKHKLGEGFVEGKFAANIEVCKKNGLISEREYDFLNSSRYHCNDAVHDIHEKNYDQVFFVTKVLEEQITKFSDLTNISISDKF